MRGIDDEVGTPKEPRWEPQTDAEHLEELRGLDSATITALRTKAQTSLFFMSKGVMGYKDVNKHTHGRFCLAVQNDQFDRQLDLMPRGHLKSSIATEADSVRLAVKDPDGTRVLIVNEVIENSIAFMDTITQQFEKNEFLRILFPELVHSRFQGPGLNWSQKSATLPRASSWKEPTWMAMGVGGAVTSKHFSHIKPDDLIGLEAKKSPAELKAAISWNRNIESLAIDAFHTRIHWIGTRWGKNDLYADVIERYGSDLKIFSRGAVENGRIIFPEKYDWKFYRRIISKTPDIWAAQYMNDPTSDMTLDFEATNLRYFKIDSDGFCVWGRQPGQRWHWTSLDRVITVDPNGGSKTAPDEAAVVVSGRAPDGKVFVLYCEAGRPSVTGFVARIFELAMKYRPRVVGIEKAGQQANRELFEQKCKDENVFFVIEDLKHRNQVKEDRIRTSLETLIADHNLWLRPSMSQLAKQIENFPDIQNDDLIDALAYGHELWRRPIAPEQEKKNKSAVIRLLNRRNSSTGYGQAAR